MVVKIEICLRSVLLDNSLDRKGIVATIADDIGVDRHTIRRLYNNEQKNPSLRVLAAVCDWLHHNGVSKRDLPGKLFGVESSQLLKAIASVHNTTMYLGEYQQVQGDLHMSWIARRDAAAAGELVSSITGIHRTVVNFDYVPFRVGSPSPGVAPSQLAEDHQIAAQKFKQMRARLAKGNAILIGSQRVNNLVEVLVADLFGCKPFQAQGQKIKVPFYLAFQTPLRAVDSCFGGLVNPPQRLGAFVQGIHYRTENKEWVTCPWVDKSLDAGVVITCKEVGIKGLKLAVFGLTGRSSEILGRHLAHADRAFWPTKAVKPGRKIGVYICRIEYPKGANIDEDKLVRDAKVSVTPLADEVLQEYLR